MLASPGGQVALAREAPGRGQPADQPNMVCGPVQAVWHEFAKYWDIEMREVPHVADCAA